MYILCIFVAFRPFVSFCAKFVGLRLFSNAFLLEIALWASFTIRSPCLLFDRPRPTTNICLVPKSLLTSNVNWPKKLLKSAVAFLAILKSSWKIGCMAGIWKCWTSMPTFFNHILWHCIFVSGTFSTSVFPSIRKRNFQHKNRTNHPKSMKRRVSWARPH